MTGVRTRTLREGLPITQAVRQFRHAAIPER